MQKPLPQIVSGPSRNICKVSPAFQEPAEQEELSEGGAEPVEPAEDSELVHGSRSLQPTAVSPSAAAMPCSRLAFNVQ